MVDAGSGTKDHTAAVSTIPAVGAPPRNISLPTEADAPVASIPGLDFDFDSIDEHDLDTQLETTPTAKNPTPAARSVARTSLVAGSFVIEMN